MLCRESLALRSPKTRRRTRRRSTLVTNPQGNCGHLQASETCSQWCFEKVHCCVSTQ